jgi:hypothetical protein
MAMTMWLALPAAQLTAPPPAGDPARRETVAGAYRRAEHAAEPVTRQDDFDRVNEGARGRTNATRSAAQAGENFPSAVDAPLSSF